MWIHLTFECRACFPPRLFNGAKPIFEEYAQSSSAHNILQHSDRNPCEYICFNHCVRLCIQNEHASYIAVAPSASSSSIRDIQTHLAASFIMKFKLLLDSNAAATYKDEAAEKQELRFRVSICCVCHAENNKRKRMLIILPHI